MTTYHILATGKAIKLERKEVKRKLNLSTILLQNEKRPPKLGGNGGLDLKTILTKV
jgi:hypothetical protein